MNLTENSYFGKKSMAYGRLGVFNLTMEAYPDKRQRNIRIWLPQEYDGARRFPVIYMHDGQNLFDDEEDRTKWYADREMEKMRKENISAIIVGIDNASTRISELCPEILPINQEACSICNLCQEEIEPTGSLYAEFITMQLKPWIDQNFQTLADKKNTIIGGSSMGGLMSFHMLLKYPDIYGNAMVFSPNFIMFTPLYNFFQKKNNVQGSLMYNKFAHKIYKGEWPVRQTYYTTKIILLVDFIAISIFILRLSQFLL